MKIYLYIVILFSSLGIFAQQDPQYTQYMYNMVNVNPAYAGNRGVTSVFLLHRAQWVGLDGAPVTNAFSIHKPVGAKGIGLGLSFVNDRIGVSDENNIAVDFSYTIRTSEDYKLSFGLKAAAHLFSVDYTKLNRLDSDDPTHQFNIDNRLSPNIGAGIYLHSERTYFGISVPNFLETTHFDSNNSSSLSKERLHYYIVAGTVFDLSSELKFKPAAMLKAVSGSPMQVDVSANFMLYDKFVTGIAYRWDAAVTAMVGFQVTNKLHIGYSYDAETTKLANYNSGSHEIFLRFEFLNKMRNVESPRFF